MKNYEMKIDLQRFADASASLNNTTATMTKEMKTFYEKRLIDQAEPRLVHDQFADYYPVPQNGGKTIEFRKYDSLPKASTPLTEGVTPNGQTLNVTTITSDLHQYGGWTPLTDVLQMTAIDNNVVQATRVLASQAGRTMDSITRDVLAGGTNVLYVPKVAEDGTETAVNSRKALDKTCTLTPKIFFRAAAQLGAMNADPIGDSYIAIIHPYAAYDLKTSKEFIELLFGKRNRRQSFAVVKIIQKFPVSLRRPLFLIQFICFRSIRHSLTSLLALANILTLTRRRNARKMLSVFQ